MPTTTEPRATPIASRSHSAIHPVTSHGSLIDDARTHPKRARSREPVVFVGIFGLVICAGLLVLAMLTKAPIAFGILAVILFQIFFTRRIVFSPTTVSKILKL